MLAFRNSGVVCVHIEGRRHGRFRQSAFILYEVAVATPALAADAVVTKTSAGRPRFV
jgi:hypothetical protein